MRRRHIPPVVASAVVVLLSAAACQGTSVPPLPPVAAGPPAIPDAQPVVDAPLFLGQNAFAAPLAHQADYAPALVTARADGGNSGVVDGPAPLGRAPVTGSAALTIQPPLLWGRGGLTAGCQIEIDPGLIKACLAAVDASTLMVTARWLPPGQDLNLDSAVVDDAGQTLVTTRQRHLYVLARPGAGGGSFKVLRDIDLASQLNPGQGLAAVALDTSGNVWFASGGVAPSGPAATDTTVGYFTSDDQVVTTTIPDQRLETALAVDQGNVFLATAPARPADHAAALGQVYDLTAAAGQVRTVWRDAYDAGSATAPGGTTRGTGSPVVLLGTQYLAVTDNADTQAHLLVYLRGPLPAAAAHSGAGATGAGATGAGATGAGATGAGATGSTATGTVATGTTAATGAATTTPAPHAATSSTSSTSSTIAPAAGPPILGRDPRLVCRVPLFSAGASAVTVAPIGYSSGDTNSVIVANGYNAPLPLANPADDGPANSINQMAAGMTRVDVQPDGSGCQTQWTTAVRLKTAPVLSSTSGLVYGYTQDEARAATGSYVWYFVAVDYRSGRVVWRQRAGAGSTKNDNRQPTVLGANGVLYQTVPLGLVWMRDVAQQP